MVPDDTSTSEAEESDGETDTQRRAPGASGRTSGWSGSTALNALVGAVVAVVLSFVPFSPALGGGVAGYLQSEGAPAGLRVGAYAGVVTALPLGLVLLVLLVLVGVGGAPELFGLLGVVLVLALVAYTVGLSALGGYLGGYVEAER